MNQNISGFTRIKNLMKAPVFEDDEEKTRVAKLLNITAWFYLVMLLIIGFVILLTNPSEFLIPGVILAVLMIPVISALVLMRNGRVHLGGWVFILTLWVCYVGLVFLSNGLKSSLVITFIPLIIMAGLILGGRAAIVVSSLSALALIGFIPIQSKAPLNPMVEMDDPVSLSLLFLFDIFQAGALLYLASDSISKALARARNNEHVLLDRNEQLQTTVLQYVDFMAKIAQGDLVVRLPINGVGKGPEDPLILLGRQLNETTASLQGMILQTREASNDLSSAAAEILAATTQQLASSNEQSASISQTTTTVEEIKTVTEHAVARAQEVAESALQTREVSKSGNQSVQETVASMDRIKQRVESIAENILALTEQTQQIGEIISTVSDIAAQSNMLSLNASVEAARAGEHGKGFAVVAAEVRSLATQSKQAAAQVRAILSDIQDATNAAVMATEEGAKQVEEGVHLATRTGATIEQLWQVIDESAQTAMQVVAGGRQQASGMEQIAQAMANINQATFQSLSSTRQAEITAQDLGKLANRLTATVAQYKL
jgi:methyl-accepting chemotaxis protein